MPSILTQEFIKDKKRFEALRAHRPRRGPIPDRLWKLVTSHVKKYGLYAREFGVPLIRFLEPLYPRGTPI
jgi:hypothetical protein